MRTTLSRFAQLATAAVATDVPTVVLVVADISTGVTTEEVRCQPPPVRRDAALTEAPSPVTPRTDPNPLEKPLVMFRSRLTRHAVTAALAGALALAPAAADAANPAAGSPSAGASGSFRQIFVDQFNRATVDRRSWAVYNNGRAAAAHLAANVVVRHGYVSLQTRYNGALHRWTTAGMCLCNQRNLRRTYGEWEMRARVSAGDSRAVALLWPSVGWPPEIDFLEMGGRGSQASRRLNTMTVHYGSHAQNYQIHSSEGGNFTRWHTVGVRWTPSKVQYLLDGAVTTTITAHVPHQQMWFGVQTAPARHNRPTRPVRFDIDWVKVYAYQG